jgi:hypothetical protein
MSHKTEEEHGKKMMTCVGTDTDREASLSEESHQEEISEE